jgi:hypothetical protein
LDRDFWNPICCRTWQHCSFFIQAYGQWRWNHFLNCGKCKFMKESNMQIITEQLTLIIFMTIYLGHH